VLYLLKENSQLRKENGLTGTSNDKEIVRQGEKEGEYGWDAEEIANNVYYTMEKLKNY